MSEHRRELDDIDRAGIRIALDEAKQGYQEGGIPIGSALLLRHDGDPSEPFKVIGKGHNLRIQKSSPTLHGEISALENAGRLEPAIYRKLTLYTTLSPCSMCSGAILLYKIPRVVIGEDKTFIGEEVLLQDRGVQVLVVDDSDCQELMKRFIEEHPEEWNEDIGEL